MKRSWLLGICIMLVIAVSCVSFSACSTAAWFHVERGGDAGAQGVDVGNGSPSEKYIVYAALDANGKLISSTDPSSFAAASSYAVVGYTGLVAELVIPNTYTDTTVSGSALPVTKVLTCPSIEVDGESQYGYKLENTDSGETDTYRYNLSMGGATYSGQYAPLANNSDVTSIVFGANVGYVGAGVCNSMINLTEITFQKTGGVTLGDYAFYNCRSLSTVNYYTTSPTVDTHTFSTAPDYYNLTPVSG